jgi:hypothetical protein
MVITMPIEKFNIPSKVAVNSYFKVFVVGSPSGTWTHRDFGVGIFYHDGPSDTVTFKNTEGHEYQIGKGAGLLVLDGARELSFKAYIKVPQEGNYVFHAAIGYSSPNGFVVVERKVASVVATKSPIPQLGELALPALSAAALATTGYVVKKARGAMLGAIVGGLIGGGYLAYKKYMEQQV